MTCQGPLLLPQFDPTHDADGATVRLVRHPDGSTSLVVIRTALPWVLRRRYLLAAELE